MNSHTLTSAALALATLGLTLTLTANSARAQDASCKPAVKARLEASLLPTKEALDKAAPSYALNCASCHGEKGDGNGPAGMVLNPKPRNFAQDNFTKSTSLLAIFNTLTYGLEGTNMPGFESLPEDERLALAHYVRNFMPEPKRAESTPEQIEEACVELSNPKLPAIPVALAMDILAEEAEAARKQGRPDLGAVKLNAAAVVENGKATFGALCASCHGADGQGQPMYTKEGRAPFVYLSTFPLSRNGAFGTWQDFAVRTADLGVHTTMDDFSDAAALSDQDWMNLQAFMATYPGSATISDDAPPPPKPRPALLSVGDGYELVLIEGRIYKLTTRTEDAEAPLEMITSYEAFRALFTKLDGSELDLPETIPADGAKIQVIVNNDCIGRRTNTEEQKPGCGPVNGLSTPEIDGVFIKADTFAPPPTPEDQDAPSNPPVP